MVPSSVRCVATDALVIGYGSDLRGDDAAGRRVADHIEARQLDGVTVVSAVQLTPEMALAIAGRDIVVFVDASVTDHDVTVQELTVPTMPTVTMTHHADPATILSLVPSVGNPPDRAFVVSIPASNLDLGADLTTETARHVAAAVEQVLALVGIH